MKHRPNTPSGQAKSLHHSTRSGELIKRVLITLVTLLMISPLSIRPVSAQTDVRTPPLYRPGTQLNPNLGIGIRNISDASFSEVVADGFTWLRVGAEWNQIETVQGQYDWTGFNNICALCLKHHLKPEWLLIYGNSLYGPACTPAGITAFANFAKACAAQSVAQGIKGARYEIWNEPENFGWLGTLYNQPNANILDATQVAQFNNASVGPSMSPTPRRLSARAPMDHCKPRSIGVSRHSKACHLQVRPGLSQAFQGLTPMEPSTP